MLEAGLDESAEMGATRDIFYGAMMIAWIWLELVGSSDLRRVCRRSGFMSRADKEQATFAEYAEDHASCCSSLTSMPLAQCPMIAAL